MMSFIIYPIGDTAVTIELGVVISEALNRKVIAMHAWLKENRPPGIKEICIAYSSLSVYYDLIPVKEQAGKTRTVFDYISNLLKEAFEKSKVNDEPGRLVRIPVCYDPDLALDSEEICNKNALTLEELIHYHTSKVYRVYMIGFLPGFAYMGQVDEKIAFPRKPAPRPLVAKGSVGIAGYQTGIYPLASPGGWQIIGRTPFRLFDPVNLEVVALHAGDQVQFSQISLQEFYELNN